MTSEIEHQIGQVINALASKGQALQMSRTEVNLKNAGGFTEDLQRACVEATKIASSEEPDLSALSKLTSFNNVIARHLIEAKFPNHSKSAKENMAFLLVQWDRLDRIASRWFTQFEGMACSSDKSRTLVNSLWDHYCKDASLEFNYAQEYVYHYPQVSLIHPEEIMEWYAAVKLMLNGRVFHYMSFTSKMMDIVKRRQTVPDLPERRILPASEALIGRPQFQILASLCRHRPSFKDDQDVLNARVLLLYAGGYLWPRGLEKMLSSKKKDAFFSLLQDWALNDTPLDAASKGWPRALFKTTNDAMHWLSLSTKARYGGENEHNAYVSFIEKMLERK